jgi:hypothetical protein
VAILDNRTAAESNTIEVINPLTKSEGVDLELFSEGVVVIFVFFSSDLGFL